MKPSQRQKGLFIQPMGTMRIVLQWRISKSCALHTPFYRIAGMICPMDPTHLWQQPQVQFLVCGQRCGHMDFKALALASGLGCRAEAPADSSTLAHISSLPHLCVCASAVKGTCVHLLSPCPSIWDPWQTVISQYAHARPSHPPACTCSLHFGQYHESSSDNCSGCMGATRWE